MPNVLKHQKSHHRPLQVYITVLRYIGYCWSYSCWDCQQERSVCCQWESESKLWRALINSKISKALWAVGNKLTLRKNLRHVWKQILFLAEILRATPTLWKCLLLDERRSSRVKNLGVRKTVLKFSIYQTANVSYSKMFSHQTVDRTSNEYINYFLSTPVFFGFFFSSYGILVNP